MSFVGHFGAYVYPPPPAGGLMYIYWGLVAQQQRLDRLVHLPGMRRWDLCLAQEREGAEKGYVSR